MISVQAREGYRVHVGWRIAEPEEVDFSDFATAEEFYQRMSKSPHLSSIRLTRVIEIDLMSTTKA